MIQVSNKRGFTIVELMLSMTFIAFLLVAIAMLTIQMSNIYTKGTTLRQVNQSGLAVSEELQRSIATTVPFETKEIAGISQKYIARDNGGRLCVGQYSYAWNYGEAIKTNPTGLLSRYSDHSNEIIRFVKVVDPGGDICADPISQDAIDRSKATEMLASGDRDLAVYSFNIVQTAKSGVTGQAIYSINFLLGTNTTAQINVAEDGYAGCKPPSGADGNENFCAINQFSIRARAGNQQGGQ